MNKLLFILFIFVSAFCYSSHNRAGEISYKRVQPFTSLVGGVSVPTYSYLITVTVYSDFENLLKENTLKSKKQFFGTEKNLNIVEE